MTIGLRARGAGAWCGDGSAEVRGRFCDLMGGTRDGSAILRSWIVEAFMMNVPLDPAVRLDLDNRFSTQDVSKAQELLETTHLPLLKDIPSLDRARIHMAAIKISNGNLKKFEQAVTLARTDWRDLLAVAGLAGEDWQQVLVREGFQVPEV